MCTHAWTMNELKFNEKWIKIKLIVNLDLIISEL
jgi:hypothetical protein